MTTDYASELIGGQATAPALAPTDYASELTGPKREFSQEMAKNMEGLSKSAPFGSLAKAAMVDDPKTKMRIYAEGLFPGDKSAIERFGLVKGEIVYVGDDDKLHKA